jgi:excisionase family DNA binding protein
MWWRAAGPSEPRGKLYAKDAERTTVKKNVTRTAAQVAHRMGVSVRSVYCWIESGRLAAYRKGEIWRIREKDIDEFIAPHRTSTTPTSWAHGASTV